MADKYDFTSSGKLNNVMNQFLNEKIDFLKTQVKLEQIINKIRNSELKDQITYAISLSDEISKINAIKFKKSETEALLTKAEQYLLQSNNLQENQARFKSCVDGFYDWNKSYGKISFEYYKNGAILKQVEFNECRDEIKKALFPEVFEKIISTDYTFIKQDLLLIEQILKIIT